MWPPIAPLNEGCVLSRRQVCDFGFSIRLPSDKSHVSNVRRGTPFYMAPEVGGAVWCVWLVCCCLWFCVQVGVCSKWLLVSCTLIKFGRDLELAL